MSSPLDLPPLEPSLTTLSCRRCDLIFHSQNMCPVCKGKADVEIISYKSESVEAREQWFISEVRKIWETANAFKGPCANIMSVKLGLLVKKMEAIE